MQVKENSFLVTGGASGLGESVARAIVSQGGNVVIADLNESAGQSLVAELGDSARFVRCDITNGDEVQSAVEMAESAFGGLQGSINCAGIVVVQKLLNRDNNPADLEAFSRGVNINLVGSFNVARLVAASIAKRITNDSSADNHVEKNADQGIIINTASIAAFDGQVGQASYSSSKAGVVGLTLPLARELARHGIRVMTIAPGVFATPMMDSIPDKAREQLEAGVPYPKRLGAPNEFAKLVTHIIDNAYLNGEVIRLDGAIRMV
ncbi:MULTISPECIES: SDR family NAD(P)-dependent oxidoreductase [unclassified Psychrobacter]|uniref:SDR family NAD(P)-dependent oxidoreductase n=1 Tax=unclassified Psychrobacter TaxID=196806 RepID=UPI000868560A|nr:MULTISPECIES: SDR family NAD(P)-dependent oxidoreductase [unclassified Psychrobacter]OEH66981.1 MAG: 3-hydroxy-2-methylbutyryl-CoA dehydrogenase [Psychrobacter sp. B29-1]TEW88036.1 SDR family NAD(P)-dependent oxidoreductase [Psychrobacter sp. 230]|tara:strand:+ start:51693 stop:52484 length:792 start_codon:yes stop_codon:yes gene_type:complete